MNYQILPVSQINKVDSYPYGRLRTTAFFSVEFVPKKGFRSVFQTIDPKTGRENKPKKGTYDHLLFCVQENETGHYKWRGYGNMSSDEGVNKCAQLIQEHGEAMQLTDDMKAFIVATMYQVIKAGMYWTHKDVAPEALQLIDPTVKAIIEMLKTKQFDFSRICLPVAELEAVRRKKEIQFVTTHHEIIG